MSERLVSSESASTGRRPNIKVVAMLLRDSEEQGGRPRFVSSTPQNNVDAVMESMVREMQQDRPPITPESIIGEAQPPHTEL